ncbi:MAG: hypothetical protein HQL20_10800 [Candidatus Omnitrophica bacterium]|nr:hypothetical protein [Candidatus Omnitrophota bacterium]
MRIWRNILLGGVALIVLLVVAGAWALNSARATGFILQSLLARTVPAVEVRGVSLGGLVYSYPASWELKDVRLNLRLNQKPAIITAPRLKAGEVLRLLKDGQRVSIELGNAEISWDKLKAVGVSGRTVLARAAGSVAYSGELSAAQVTWDQLTVDQVRVALSGDTRELECKDLTAAAYGGALTGKARLMFTAVPGYALEVDYRNLETWRLDRALGGAFGELGGKLSGRFKAAGQGERITVLEVSSGMPAGGQVSAALLSSIASYLPSSAQKKRLEFLISSGGKLAVEVFSFTIRNDAPDHLSGEIGLKSREMNLELNVSHEITVDARIDALLKAWQALASGRSGR